MTSSVMLLLAGAGVIGGVANAISGGATLITFPAMLATGLPPVIANASNAVAVTPGHLIAAIADRKRIPPLTRRLVLLFLISVLGAIVGAALLLFTSDRAFTKLVPLLIGVATLVYAFSAQIQKLVHKRTAREAHPLAAEILLALSTVYGGYFGGGLGVMLLAILTVIGMDDVRAANVLKNLLATAVSLVAVTIFWMKGVVSWPETLVMLCGAIVGGFLGGHLVRTLPSAVVRAIVIAAGGAMTLYYAWRYWI